MVEYGLALKRPFTDWSKFFIGVGLYVVVTLLLLVPIAGWLASMLIELVLVGFALVCAKTIMEKKKEMPSWKKPLDLWMTGLKGLVILMVYFIPALVVGGIVGGVAFLTGVATGGTMLSVFGSIGLSAVLLILVLVLTSYVVPVALVKFAEKGKMGAAFECKKVFKTAFTGKYFVPWLVGVLYGFLVLMVSGALQLATALSIVVPFVLAAAASFIVLVTFFTLVGQAVSEVK